jgi:hypothetical protein
MDEYEDIDIPIFGEERITFSEKYYETVSIDSNSSGCFCFESLENGELIECKKCLKKIHKECWEKIENDLCPFCRENYGLKPKEREYVYIREPLSLSTKWKDLAIILGFAYYMAILVMTESMDSKECKMSKISSICFCIVFPISLLRRVTTAAMSAIVLIFLAGAIAETCDFGIVTLIISEFLALLASLLSSVYFINYRV